MGTFQVKDSGKREEFASGMVRDTQENKVDYTLVFDGPMFQRFAEHLTAGSRKYDPRNWMKASGQEEADRFRQSAMRHFIQWFRGDTDEDHAAAVWFNINGYEYTKEKLNEQGSSRGTGSSEGPGPDPQWDWANTDGAILGTDLCWCRFCNPASTDWDGVPPCPAGCASCAANESDPF